jgi:hypothetical protein
VSCASSCCGDDDSGDSGSSGFLALPLPFGGVVWVPDDCFIVVCFDFLGFLVLFGGDSGVVVLIVLVEG